MLVYLIHVRDPQFYALPAKTRAMNGNVRVMGFPPIGIMSLSSVIKQAGHDCVMFDQANPDTPNQVIIDRINRASRLGPPSDSTSLILASQARLRMASHHCVLIPTEQL